MEEIEELIRGGIPDGQLVKGTSTETGVAD